MFAAVEENAADPINPAQAIYEGAIPGMLRRLDPFSVFFDPGQFEQLNELEKSTRKGFGSVVSILPGRVIVLQTLPGTPSAKSGMSPGDEIVAVNGIPLARLDTDQLVQLLSQSRQSAGAAGCSPAGECPAASADPDAGGCGYSERRARVPDAAGDRRICGWAASMCRPAKRSRTPSNNSAARS